MTSKRLSLALLVGLVLGSTAPLRAQTDVDAIIEQVRRQTEDILRAGRLGASYAALVNFALNPDISTATYYIDTPPRVDEATLNVSRLPLRYAFEIEDRPWRPFVEGNLAYQTLDSGFKVAEGERIDNVWTAFGVSAGGGLEFDFGEDFTLLAGVHGGYVRLDSEADYRGPASTTILDSAFRGVLFDWTADAWLVGGMLALQYERAFDHFGLEARAGLGHNYIASFDSSSGLVEFEEHATTLNFQVGTVHSLGVSVLDCPLSFVPQLGNTTFVGNARDELGFGYFFEAGVALQADISSYHPPLDVRSLRVGAKGIFGEDVIGWGLIIGFRF